MSGDKAITSPRVAFGRTLTPEKKDPIDPSLLFEWEKQQLDTPYY